MSKPLHNDALGSLPSLRPTWITWAWLAFAAMLVVALVVGFLRAGRPFWHVACEHFSNLSSLRA